MFYMKSALPGLHPLLLLIILLLNSCKETAIANENTRPSKPLLRYVVPLMDRDIYLDEMVKQCRSMGIDEVLQFTMLTNGEYGGDAFYDDEEFEKRMEHFRYCADRIRKEGLILSINAFHTLGHIRSLRKWFSILVSNASSLKMASQTFIRCSTPEVRN